ncbi:MAG TPA: DUF4331 family protein [Puia sp.]|jgi:hypothetical protein|nr:DUF4331 family protein [Puia sp.]
MNQKLKTGRVFLFFTAVTFMVAVSGVLMSSSHREAPMIANDPLADNTDLYVFRSPDHPDKITILANYIPAQLPFNGPNYYQFGEDIRYEIHIDNDVATRGDDIVYRFTFHKTNQDPTTFFNIRLGKQNLKTTYTLEKSRESGRGFETIIHNGIVPPPNIGPRSISSPVGLNVADYNTLINNAITTARTGEKVFCGTADDPFFVDLGGIFDLGDAPRTTGSKSMDALKCKNVSVIALQVDIEDLQKDRKSVSHAKNILDPDYVIGVWASASRRKIRTLNTPGLERFFDSRRRDRDDDNDHYRDDDDQEFETSFGPWVQISRLGMPLTNEAVIPIGKKDLWNFLTPYEDLANIKIFGKYFYNPELALYMDDTYFGGAVPALKPLRIQRNSLGAFGFGNNQNGLYGLKGSSALTGTALDDAIFGTLLLPAPNSPRSVDLWPIFHTGVPNLRPYQLATGKKGNPLAAGKPFINNFLPNGGDMLRLNMAVPPTRRNDPKFSALGLVQAAVLGLTDTLYNKNLSLQFIPNMDGFPNGRRLEDDVTRIELQAVSGVVLAAIGLWYDDFKGGANPVTPNLVNVLTYNTGVNANDTTFKTSFPYVQTPWSGDDNCCGVPAENNRNNKVVNSVDEMDTYKAAGSTLDIAAPDLFLSASPNPFVDNNTIRYHIETASQVRIEIHDASGRLIKVLVDGEIRPGTYSVPWNAAGLAKGVYFIYAIRNGSARQTIRVVKQ